MYPEIDIKKTGECISKLMKQKGITVKDVQQQLMLGSVQSVYHWLNGLSLPSVDNLYALSDMLNVSMDDLICGNRQNKKVQKTDILYLNSLLDAEIDFDKNNFNKKYRDIDRLQSYCNKIISIEVA